LIYVKKLKSKIALYQDIKGVSENSLKSSLQILKFNLDQEKFLSKLDLYQQFDLRKLIKIKE
jgi:hypothetical protein